MFPKSTALAESDPHGLSNQKVWAGLMVGVRECTQMCTGAYSDSGHSRAESKHRESLFPLSTENSSLPVARDFPRLSSKRQQFSILIFH